LAGNIQKATSDNPIIKRKRGVPDTMNIYEQKPDMDTMGGRLSRARDASGLTARDLAWRLGVKIATVNAWERDRSQPATHRLNMLSGLLNVSISWLLHGVGASPADPLERLAAEKVNGQLERLRSLHAETGQLIGRITEELGNLGRVNQSLLEELAAGE
jgi:transcriptional regulator with XRE-family HTH domain